MNNMNKIIPAIALVGLLVLPFVTLAQKGIPDECTLTRDLTDIDPACMEDYSVPIEDYGMCCLVNTIYAITDWIFYIIMAFVGIMIVIGAFTIITAGGNPDNVNKGRNYILYAVIGMVVAFFARAIPAIVKSVIGVG